MIDGDSQDNSAVTLVVEYDGADDLIGDFTETLSSGRTFVTTSRQLSVGARVELMLSFPGLIEPIAIEGTVRCAHPSSPGRDSGVDIEFGAGRDHLASVVERIRNRDPKIVSRLFRILIVDDNRHVAALIQEGLRTATRREFGDRVSFVFQLAEEGRTAVELLGRETFDALIIDVYMPVLDGPRVISQARTQLGLSELPIIAVSAGGDAARRSALEAGANIFFEKPMRLRQVIGAIQHLLRMSTVAERVGADSAEQP